MSLVGYAKQREGRIDFGETFAPTVSSSCVRLLSAIACELDLDVCDKNVNHICCAAFLKPVSFQAHSQHHKGSIYHCCGCLGDMWRARVLFWGAPLQDADQLRVFLSTGNSRDFSDHNGQL